MSSRWCEGKGPSDTGRVPVKLEAPPGRGSPATFENRGEATETARDSNASQVGHQHSPFSRAVNGHETGRSGNHVSRDGKKAASHLLLDPVESTAWADFTPRSSRICQVHGVWLIGTDRQGDHFSFQGSQGAFHPRDSQPGDLLTDTCRLCFLTVPPQELSAALATITPHPPTFPACWEHGFQMLPTLKTAMSNAKESKMASQVILTNDLIHA